MGCSKKQLIIFTIINFLMLCVIMLCTISMGFNLLSLILATVSSGSIFFSSISIWRNGKLYRR